MQIKESALILIIIGIIVLAFPIIGVMPFSLITGVITLILGVSLLFAALFLIEENKGIGIGSLILGSIFLILGIGFIINPVLFSFLAASFVFITGLFLVGVGIATIIGNFGGDIRSGIIVLVIGVVYLIIATWVSDPAVLGTLIGLWFLITGFLMLFQKDKS